MKRVFFLLLVVCGLGLAVPRPAWAIRGMCAAAQFFNYQSELFNDLCWIELSLTPGEVPEEGDYPYVD